MTITAPAPLAHFQELDRIDDLIDDLEQAITSLINASWGTADDGTTSIPCPDGTGAELASRLIALAHNVTTVCEHRKDLAQPGTY